MRRECHSGGRTASPLWGRVEEGGLAKKVRCEVEGPLPALRADLPHKGGGAVALSELLPKRSSASPVLPWRIIPVGSVDCSASVGRYVANPKKRYRSTIRLSVSSLRLRLVEVRAPAFDCRHGEQQKSNHGSSSQCGGAVGVAHHFAERRLGLRHRLHAKLGGEQLAAPVVLPDRRLPMSGFAEQADQFAVHVLAQRILPDNRSPASMLAFTRPAARW